MILLFKYFLIRKWGLMDKIQAKFLKLNILNEIFINFTMSNRNRVQNRSYQVLHLRCKQTLYD